MLAGGRGRRMGGTDKGLQLFGGVPLARHALARLAPQVGPLVVSANRNRGAYEAFGVPVLADSATDPGTSFSGPLAGFLAAWQHCTTPYLATVPCDAPGFPADLVARLGAALEASGSDIAFAATRENGELRAQPVFCLMRAAVVGSLALALAEGQRKVGSWLTARHATQVVFDDGLAFANVNSAEELQRLEHATRAPG